MTHLVPLYPASALRFSQQIKSVDISELNDDDFISIALPALPLTGIDLSQSNVQFTSEPDGNFGIGPTDSVAFSQSETTLVSGNSEFRFQIGLLDSIDRSSITGVKFIVSTTVGGGDFRVLSIRALSRDWVYTPIDFNTLGQYAKRPVSLNGNPSAVYDSVFAVWPNLFRAGNLTSEKDPKPIDVKLAVRFNTGSIDGDNQFSIFLREKAVDYQTQLDLDTTPVGDLEGLPQPDYGEAKYISRTQIDIDSVEDIVPGAGVGMAQGPGLTQADLDSISQFDLERKADSLSAVWIEVRFFWNTSGSTVAIYDAEQAAPFYTFATTLDPNRDYVAIIDLEARSLLVEVYEQQGGTLGDKVFSSTKINDIAIFKRRKGRVGWHANFSDGDALIEGIEPQGVNYAEYRSQAFESITPVSGASLYVGATEDSDIFKGINSGPWGGQLYDNPERGPESFRIRNTAVRPLQGVQTNPVYLDDVKHTKFSFDLYVADTALALGSMSLFLWNGVDPRTLPLPHLTGNVWNHIEIDLDAVGPVLPDNYTFVIVQTVTGVPNDWAIDDLSIRRRSIEWSARSYLDDAWGTREDTWVDAGDTVNQSGGGVVFTDKSNKLQVRAKALREDAQIGSVNAIPKYAELGRFNWNLPVTVVAPSPTFTASAPARSITFTSTTDQTDLILQQWSFGDGKVKTGAKVTHKYDEAGSYPVTLTVVSSSGDRKSYTQSVTVT